MYKGKKLMVSHLGGGLIELSVNAQDASVNVFNNALVKELDEALTLIENTADIVGMLVSSAKNVFIVGADITEFSNIFAKPYDEMKSCLGINIANFNRVEDLPFPTVVAINGFALGGGFEFCMACDFRVMANQAKIGLPETGLGIIPGWGGTVRAPRLMGLENAMAWIATGKHYNAEESLQAGLVDHVAEIEFLRETAIGVLNQAVADTDRCQMRRQQKISPMEIASEQATEYVKVAKNKFTKSAPMLAAPSAAIDHLAAVVSVDREAGLALEFDLLNKLAKNAQARALIGNFINEQFINRVASNYAKESSIKFQKTAVIGAGIMGGGIAYQSALMRIPVVMKDINMAALNVGNAEADKLLSNKVRQGRMDASSKQATLELISPTVSMTDVKGSDVVVEAVVENPEVKKNVLAELEDVLAGEGVLVSNTSTISISRLAQGLKRPEKFAGMHFFNPVHAMPLVEIVRGERTSEKTIADVVAYALALGKTPIVVNDCPAFLVNRVLFPYLRGFELLIRDGADFHAIDSAMEAWGWPMGPAYLSDVCGIDTLRHCQFVLAVDFSDRMGLVESSAMEKMYINNRYGQKNGFGFYQYQPDSKGRPVRSTDAEARVLIAECQYEKQSFTDEEIVIRCMLPMALEMARCREEGVVASAAEADMALLYGLGFPSFRGGILRWMDEVGAQTLCEWSDKYSYLGTAYRVTDGLKAMSESSGKYY